jgi:hypothetical protein
MGQDESLSHFRRTFTGLCFVVFPAVWVFAFAVHPDLLHPRLLLGPEDLIRRAHANDLLQVAHALVTVNTALLVVVAVHFMTVLKGTRAARAGVVGAGLAVVGAVLLAADKGALCLTMSALDTLPQRQFEQMMPGLVAIFSLEGLLVMVWGMVLMPVGVMIQSVGLWRAKVLPARQATLLVTSLVLIAFPDGAEIVNLAAALVMAAVLIPYGVRLIGQAEHPAVPPARLSKRPGPLGTARQPIDRLQPEATAPPAPAPPHRGDHRGRTAPAPR